MRKFWQSWSPKRRRVALALVGAVVGAGLGFGYYLMVGCPTGGCPITSNPWATTGYGAVFGALIGGT